VSLITLREARNMEMTRTETEEVMKEEVEENPEIILSKGKLNGAEEVIKGKRKHLSQS
jgi:hypothetical protein